MSAAARLAAFAALLVAVFVIAAVAGGALGPDRDGESRAATDGGHTGEASHGAGDGPAKEDGMTTQAPSEVRGLAVADRGLKLVVQDTEIDRGEDTELRFTIAGADGAPVRDFEVEHEERMHLIVVRRDGRGFQHLHPELGEGGVWRTRVTLPEPGSYRVFADFKRGGEAVTLAADVFVDGRADYRPLPPAAKTADAGGGYEVTLEADRVRAGHEAELRFTVRQNGRTIHTEPYLGAGGHLVALREGDLAYLHVHPGGHGAEGDPHDDAVAFMSEFPSAGRYRLYLQFKHDGRIHTAEFTQDVAR